MFYTTSLLSGFFVVVEVDEHRFDQDNDTHNGNNAGAADTDDKPLRHVEHLLAVSIQQECGDNVDQSAQNGQNPRCL